MIFLYNYIKYNMLTFYHLSFKNINIILNEPYLDKGICVYGEKEGT